MKFFALSYVAALLAYGVTADEDPIRSSMFKHEFLTPATYGVPIPSLGLGSQMTRMTYPGYKPKEGEEELYDGAKLKVNFYGWTDRPSQGGYAQRIPDAGGIVLHSNITLPSCFGFALPGEKVIKDKWYSGEFCIENSDGKELVCSGVSEPATKIDSGSDNKIECGAHTNLDIVAIKSMAKPEQVNMVKNLPNSKAQQLGVNENSPLIRFEEDGKEKIYSIVSYNMETYRAMLTDESDDSFCQRKYIVSILIHVMKKSNQQVVARARLTPHLSNTVLGLIKNGQEVPIQTVIDIDHVKAQINDNASDFEMRYTVCFDDKNSVGDKAVKCSTPFKYSIPESQ